MIGEELSQHTMQPDEPWYHPHHIMHHGDKIVAAIGVILVALFVAWLKHRHGWGKKRRD